MALLGHLARLGGADLIQRLIHLGHDVEAIQDVQRLGAFRADHPEVRLPHVRADELDPGGQLGANHREEALDGVHRPLFADP